MSFYTISLIIVKYLDKRKPLLQFKICCRKLIEMIFGFIVN